METATYGRLFQGQEPEAVVHEIVDAIEFWRTRLSAVEAA